MRSKEVPMFAQLHPAFDQHDEVAFFHDSKTGLRAIVALHRAYEKPSVGGCRVRDYGSEEEALADVLRLSRGMTYKSVMAGLAFGGAKAVIIGVPEDRSRAAAMRAMAGITNRFGGRFRTGVDLGLTPADVDVMRAESPYIFGDPARPASNVTADGLLVSIKAIVRHRLSRPSLNGVRVAVQGLGKVGMRITALLVKEGARVTVGDVDARRAERAGHEFGAIVTEPDRVHAADVDLFCPCALGGVLNDQTVGELKAQMVAGAANNQLATPEDGERLQQRGVLFAPDYVANAGGLIAVAAELEGRPDSWINEKVDGLKATLDQIFDEAQRTNSSASLVADELARERIRAIETALRSAA